MAISWQRACPGHGPDAQPRAATRQFPRSPSDRSASEAPSSVPAASPRLRRRPSAWPPGHGSHVATESGTAQDRPHALHTGPISARFETGFAITGLSHAGSLSLHLLASPGRPAPSGSPGTTHPRRGRFRPPRRSPDQAAPGFTRPLRRPGGEGLSPPLDHYSASWRTVPSRRKSRPPSGCRWPRAAPRFPSSAA
jgi:hypothetical protein